MADPIFSRFFACRRGNVAMMFGLFLVPLLLSAGAAIDMLRINLARGELREAADSGVLAAARAKILDSELTQDDAKAIARRLFDGNNAASGGNVTIDSFDFRFDPDTDRFILDVEARIDAAFLSVVGRETLPISLSSEAKGAPAGPVEVVMVLDNTGSMAGDKLTSLKTSATLLVNTLLQDPAGEFRVGLVPFAQYVNIGAANSAASWLSVPALGGGDVWNGCVGSRNYPSNLDDGGFSSDPAPGVLNVDCPQAVFPLTGDKSLIQPKIDAMTASGSTYIPAGLTWGRRLLSSEEPFTEGLTSSQIDAKKGVKAIILLSDGANTRAPSYPAHDVNNQANADGLTTELCNDIEDDDVRIYSIAFEVSDASIETLLRNCASDDGGYFDAADSLSLEAAFEAIATDLVELAISG